LVFAGKRYVLEIPAETSGKKLYVGDSKMAMRGRKQKECFLQKTLGEMLEIHLTEENHQEEAKL
jgi:hypothetical protein